MASAVQWPRARCVALQQAAVMSPSLAMAQACRVQAMPCKLQLQSVAQLLAPVTCLRPARAPVPHVLPMT